MANVLTEEHTGTPVQILNPEGRLVAELPAGLDAARLGDMYRWMVRLRAFDQRALSLQRQGRLGTYPPYSGQEACQVGVPMALEPRDWICPTYRDHGAMLVHGASMLQILRYWQGDEWGSAMPEGVRNFPIAIPIATQCVHATGLAWAGRLKGTGEVAVAFFGDGATSQGDFHEALNFAAVFRAPAIFFCQNNGYAISVPITQQMKSETIAQKAAAYGLPGVRVDGNDILAVWQVMQEAVARGRQDGAATLIEALTYRYGPHTTADDPSRYRSDDEVKSWAEHKDPITRLRLFLLAENIISAQDDAAWQEDAKNEVNEAVQAAEAMATPEPGRMFDHVWAETPACLQQQKDGLLQILQTGGGDPAGA